MRAVDVAVIGGGIIGTAAAAYLAEAGRSVALFERSDIGAGASGRNSGAVQHPFDPVLAALHARSVELYRDERLVQMGFELPSQPAGLMLVSFNEAAVAAATSDLARNWPSLSPLLLSPGSAAREEPALHSEVAACRIETAYPVAPASATLAFAERARRAGTEVRTSEAATVATNGARATGVLLSGNQTLRAGQVLVAAGPWSSALIRSWHETAPITSIWGVVVSTTLESPPTAVLEELGIDRPGAPPDRLFSLVTAGGRTSVGSTFLRAQPQKDALAPELLKRGQTFVPALANAKIEAVRECARPASFDGRPLIGAIPGTDGLFVCAGHGPWGVSTGPASAELIARQMLGNGEEVAELSPQRIPASTHADTEFG